MGIGNINNAWMATYQYASKTQRNNTAETDSTGFLSAVYAKQADKTDRTSLEDMWKHQFPGAYYHVMDGSKISQAAWDRNDFPFEKFFSDNLDESILDWQPSGAEPSDFDSKVITRRSSVAGQKAIIVHPALEEKMKNNPELAEKVMQNLENWIAEYPAEPGCSYLIELDENGEIAKFCVTGPLRITHSVTETGREKVDQLHEEYEKIAEENALKRKLQQQIIEKEYFEHKAMAETALNAYENAVSTYNSTPIGNIL